MKWEVQLAMRLSPSQYFYTHIPCEQHPEEYPSIDMEILKEAIEEGKAEFPEATKIYLYISQAKVDRSYQLRSGRVGRITNYSDKKASVRIPVDFDEDFGSLVMKIATELSVTPAERIASKVEKKREAKKKGDEPKGFPKPPQPSRRARDRAEPQEHPFKAKIKQFSEEVAALREMHPDETKWDADLKREINGREIYIQMYRRKLEEANNV